MSFQTFMAEWRKLNLHAEALAALSRGGSMYSDSRLLSFEERAAPAFYMAAFLVTYQIATLFDDLRELLAMQCIRAFFKRLLHL
jgi:hypothetical protein